MNVNYTVHKLVKSSNRYFFYVAFMIFNILDAKFTLYNIERYNAIELNPILKELMYINPMYMLYFKIIIGLVFVGVLIKIHHKHKKYHDMFLVVLIIMMIIACGSSVILWI